MDKKTAELRNMMVSVLGLTEEEADAKIAEMTPERSDEDIALDNIWMVVHFYVDDTSEFRDVKKDAKDEREVRGSNVKVFAHDHSYRESECSKKCLEVVAIKRPE